MDDGSQDHTREVVPNLAREYGLPLNYIYRNKPSNLTYDVCSIPRNIGLKACTCDWIVVSEPEALYVTDVIAQFMTQAEAKPNHVISAGCIYFMGPETPASELIFQDPRRCINGLWDVKKFAMHPEDMLDDQGKPVVHTRATVRRAYGMVAPYAALYKREWLMQIGGWDEDMSLLRGGGGYAWDDTDLLTRLRLMGINQFIDPDIQVIHQYHEPPPPAVADGWRRNSEIFYSKKFESDGQTDPLNRLVANRGREWGIL